MRRLVVLAPVIALAVTGCESPVRDKPLEAAVRTSFTNLYVLQQRQRDLPVEATDLHTRANCLRDNASSPRSGPGNDWVCNLTWRTRSATTGGATYSVTVRPDGCFSADGDGPVDLVGSQTLVDAEGETVLNPLWAFDGCFELT